MSPVLNLFIFQLIFSHALICYAGKDNSGIYTSVSPKTLRSNSTYNVNIALEKGQTISNPSPATFILSINCSNAIFKGELQNVEPGKSISVPILIGDIPKGNDECKLTIFREISGQTLKESAKIYVNRRESSVLVQTDKPIYKPGETVNFRVVLLNRKLRPIDCKDVNITVYDPQRNVIKNWKEAPVTMGLHSSKIILSSESNLGDWKIEVDFDNEKTEKTFTVDQYVLPKFKVEIKLPPFVTFASSRVMAEVRATYTYGKPISGNCTVRLRQYYYWHHWEDQDTVERSMTLTNGVAFIEFDILKDLNIQNHYEEQFQFDAFVVESVTGRELNSTARIQMYQHSYKIEKIMEQESTKPGFPVIYNFKVSTQDNIPISDNRSDAVAIVHGYSYDIEKGYYNSSLPSNGTVTLTVQAPSNEIIEPSQIIVTYKDLTVTFYTPQKINSPSKTYMQVTVTTESPKFGEPIEAILNANKQFTAMNYVVLSRGEILNFEKFENLTESTQLKFNFVVPAGRGGPEAKLVVYGVFPNQDEIVADSSKINFQQVPLDNYLNISLSAKRVEPGQNVTVNLKSRPTSMIAIKAIDQSILLLKNENDITEGTLQNEITRFNKENGNHRIWGGSSYYQIFEEAGLVILTNGYIERSWQYNSDNERRKKRNACGESELESATIASELESTTPLSDDRIDDSNNEQTPPIRIRKQFDEVWIFEEIISTSDTTSITRTVPDTLTSWVITGFALNAESGIGVSLRPKILETFRPFFLSLNLPYSIVKGEVFPLNVLIHNYLGDNITTAAITLENKENHFKFVADKEKGQSSVTKEVQIVNGEVASVTFVIVPTKFGILKLDVKGVTSIAGDGLSQPLIVKPPGHKEIRNNAILLDLRNGQPMGKQSLTADFPDDRVKGADVIKISVIGDLLGASITNLDNLIQLPTGCGEQNMLNFVADIVILDYLKALDTLTPEVKAKALRYLDSGYQRQLTYRHPDGSFSVFGTSDQFGSTWLTAFVLKSFAAAANYTTIDENILNLGVDFLIRQQQKDGEFIEMGRVFNSDIQGGSAGSGLALTSYVVLSLFEISKAKTELEIKPKIAGSIKKGLDYITVKYHAAVRNPYALNLAAYTLNLAGHEKKDEIFNLVEQQAKLEGDLKFWEKSDHSDTISKDNATAFLASQRIWHPQMKPASVEMTSYALMTYLIRDRVTESIPVARWLLRQRNTEGGFLSTQDTVVGLTALARFALLTTSPNPDLKIQAVYDNKSQEIVVNKDNSYVLQEFFLPGESHTVDFRATGNGTALSQLSWSYYVEGSPLSTFVLDVEVMKHNNPGTMPIRICNRFVNPTPSNMAVIEVRLPSGYYFDAETVKEVLQIEDVRRHELDEADTKLNIYFDSFSNSSTCLSVSANRVFQIANPANASVYVYDYYDNTRRGITFYQPAQLSVCDICKDEKSCKIENCV